MCWRAAGLRMEGRGEGEDRLEGGDGENSKRGSNYTSQSSARYNAPNTSVCTHKHTQAQGRAHTKRETKT